FEHSCFILYTHLFTVICFLEKLQFSRWMRFKTLKQKFKLVIISNVDDDLFAFSAKHLEVEFDQIITAEQAKSYKPSLNNFRLAIERIALPLEQILHVAASVYHDIVTAKSLGLSTVWVNRRAEQKGVSATGSALSQPDLEVPDLKTLAALSYPKQY
ncbi:MAG: HAD hydrolase-like protein, partial [Nostoc sp.]|uniref:HAD hydrolase-like protein n=1 Tax=Nostoc sp. TaxID=1180 RepID=UPI002FF97542